MFQCSYKAELHEKGMLKKKKKSNPKVANFVDTRLTLPSLYQGNGKPFYLPHKRK